jgi:predicted DNA-binding transcriptional regulator AlpA
MSSDTDTVNLSKAAKAMGVSRWTIYNWMASGYEPEYGHLTTLGHLKRWLREVYRPRVAAARKAKRLAQERQLDRLR